VKVGLQIPRFDWPGNPGNIGQTLAEVGRAADAAGFASLWVMDHFFQIAPGLGPADSPMLEAYSALSFLAGVTGRATLGALVTAVTYRVPGHLIKAVTTLDVLSGGRAILGIGAGWYEQEARGLGLPFPPLKERFERLEEALQIARMVWSGERGEFKGRHYHLAEPIVSPPPLSQPRPRILIGGLGERKTLRLVAQYADACNLFVRIGNDELKRKLDILERHCDEVGRDYAEIERTSLDTADLRPGHMTPKDVIDECQSLAAMGFSHAIFNLPEYHDPKVLDTFGREIIPAVAGF
jgi:F420-dependent oxidoreductase-like protein